MFKFKGMRVLGRILVIASVCITTTTKTIAQQRESGYEFGIGVGTLIYQGDLVPGFLGDYRTLKPALNVFAGKAIDPFFSVRGNLTVGKILADEARYTKPEWRQSRNFKFSTPVTELSATVVFRPTAKGTDPTDRKISPYVFAGVGVSFLNVKRDYSRVDTTVFGAKSDVQLGLGRDTVRSLPRALPVLPVGLGVDMVLSSSISLNAALTYRFTKADYIDGFKYAGNPKNEDAYYGISVGLTFRPGGYRCPSVW
ncbi:hypothetical protein EXU57_03315 [Segetibacter sp. 3557_3]|uniref:DUF6089 family protein n=1 Tax=Segetibacter sp. 3557_3 TaxID=2547429 RepID=UPI00105907EB|nr:DUF6089 family protein [Segetibacter sp. 3557_3]TDH29109.1 hypothetical protein EXU57_03315 [Segetibacter sp. 3557_3]